jgi:hypothetical protein
LPAHAQLTRPRLLRPGLGPAGDLDAAFARALRNDSGDMHLARLLQRTGIVWNSLSRGTCGALLAAFVRCAAVARAPLQLLRARARAAPPSCHRPFATASRACQCHRCCRCW